jgi:four helix bundle protein
LVLREARETHYWLRLLAASELAKPDEIQDVVNEADELVAIFTSAVRKAKRPLAPLASRQAEPRCDAVSGA